MDAEVVAEGDAKLDTVARRRAIPTAAKPSASITIVEGSGTSDSADTPNCSRLELFVPVSAAKFIVRKPDNRQLPLESPWKTMSCVCVTVCVAMDGPPAAVIVVC